MAKVLQKTADVFREVSPSERELLHPDEFYDRFQISCYEPAPELAPFVVYMWIQRWDLPLEVQYRSESEVFSEPNHYLFFTQDDAFIHGVRTEGFDYDVSGKKGVIAGAKFKPGGLYPFCKKPLSTLSEKKLRLSLLFPEVDDSFRKKLLAQDDQGIVADLNTLLYHHLPSLDKNVELIGKILNALQEDDSLDTVGKVAQRFARSERNLQEIFQAYVGVGVKWVLMRNRLLRAAEYARSVDKPNWVEIAHKLGYSSQSHFVSDFKRIIGQTPSQYVQSMH